MQSHVRCENHMHYVLWVLNLREHYRVQNSRTRWIPAHVKLCLAKFNTYGDTLLGL